MMKFLLLFIPLLNILYGYSAKCYVKSYVSDELQEDNKYIHINVQNRVLTLTSGNYISSHRFDSIYKGDYIYSTPPAVYIYIGTIKNNKMTIFADFSDGFGYNGKCHIED